MADPDRRGPAPTPLADGFVQLVPTALVDPRALYQLAYASGSATWWRTRGLTVSLERFAGLVNESGDASFAVFNLRAGSELAGFVGLHSQDHVSRTACASAFFDRRRPESRVVAAASLRCFASYVFRAVGVRKLMLEVPGSTSDYLLSACEWSPVIHHEGTLRSHTRMGAHLEDLHLFAVFADEYLARYGASRAPATRVPPGASTFDAVCAALRTVQRKDEVMMELSGGHRLVEDLALDSLALLELIDVLEHAHPGAFDLVEELDTVQDLVDVIDRRICANPAG